MLGAPSPFWVVPSEVEEEPVLVDAAGALPRLELPRGSAGSSRLQPRAARRVVAIRIFGEGISVQTPWIGPSGDGDGSAELGVVLPVGFLGLEALGLGSALGVGRARHQLVLAGGKGIDFEIEKRPGVGVSAVLELRPLPGALVDPPGTSVKGTTSSP